MTTSSGTTGRTLCTAAVLATDGAFFKFQMDNGYKIWTFQGELLNDVSKEAFYQFSWRPRPVVSGRARAKIAKNLPSTSASSAGR